MIYDLKLKCQSLRGQTLKHKLKHEPVEILGFWKKNLEISLNAFLVFPALQKVAFSFKKIATFTL